MSTPQKPAHEIRLGTIKATIWRNDIENGVRYNTTLSRIYRDGEQWKNTESFGRDDLLLVAKVANEAHSWIFTQAREHPNPAAANGSGPAGAGQGSVTGAGVRSGGFAGASRAR